ncbi:MAG: serine/threonine-protein kinase [Polyangiales bacterium]
MAAPQVGSTVLGQYVIEGVLAPKDRRGKPVVPVPLDAEKAVYKARDQLGRLFAIKWFVLTNDEQRQRVLREARVLEKLEDPRLVSSYEAAIDESEAFIVLYFVEGVELTRELRAAKRHELVQYVVDVAYALQVAHDGGLVHRDVKPANVMLTRAEERIRAVLVDFGSARVLAEDPLTKEGTLIGTLKYMSPEQRAPSAHVARSTDVFSLGLVFVEGLIGRREDEEGRVLSTVATDLVRGVSGALRKVDETIPPELEQLAADMLSVDPEKRPPIAHVIARLEPFIQAPKRVSISSPPPPPPKPDSVLPLPPEPRPRARWWLRAGYFAAALGLALLVAMFVLPIEAIRFIFMPYGSAAPIVDAHGGLGKQNGWLPWRSEVDVSIAHSGAEQFARLRENKADLTITTLDQFMYEWAKDQTLQMVAFTNWSVGNKGIVVRHGITPSWFKKPDSHCAYTTDTTLEGVLLSAMTSWHEPAQVEKSMTRFAEDSRSDPEMMLRDFNNRDVKCAVMFSLMMGDVKGDDACVLYQSDGQRQPVVLVGRRPRIDELRATAEGKERLNRFVLNVLEQGRKTEEETKKDSAASEDLVKRVAGWFGKSPDAVRLFIAQSVWFGVAENVELMGQNGQGKKARVLISQMIEHLKRQRPDATKQSWPRVHEVIRGDILDEIAQTAPPQQTSGSPHVKSLLEEWQVKPSESPFFITFEKGTPDKPTDDGARELALMLRQIDQLNALRIPWTPRIEGCADAAKVRTNDVGKALERAQFMRDMYFKGAELKDPISVCADLPERVGDEQERKEDRFVKITLERPQTEEPSSLLPKCEPPLADRPSR